MSARPGEVASSEHSCGWLGVGSTRVDGEPPSATGVRAGSTSAAPERSGFVDTGAAAATDARASRPGPSSMRALFLDGDESDAAAVQCPRIASASRSRRARPGLVAAMLARVRPASASSWARSCRRRAQCASNCWPLPNHSVLASLDQAAKSHRCPLCGQWPSGKNHLRAGAVVAGEDQRAQVRAAAHRCVVLLRRRRPHPMTRRLCHDAGRMYNQFKDKQRHCTLTSILGGSDRNCNYRDAIDIMMEVSCSAGLQELLLPCRERVRAHYLVCTLSALVQEPTRIL